MSETGARTIARCMVGGWRATAKQRGKLITIAARPEDLEFVYRALDDTAEQAEQATAGLIAAIDGALAQYKCPAPAGNADACARCGGRRQVRNDGLVWVACPACAPAP